MASLINNYTYSRVDAGRGGTGIVAAILAAICLLALSFLFIIPV
jgi:hypothetical protein